MPVYKSKTGSKYYGAGNYAFARGKKFVPFDRTRNKSTAWRKDAWKFLRKKNWNGARGYLRNALHNLRRYGGLGGGKVGWTAKDASWKNNGKARAMQRRWRKKYFTNHKNVI